MYIQRHNIHIYTKTQRTYLHVLPRTVVVPIAEQNYHLNIKSEISTSACMHTHAHTPVASGTPAPYQRKKTDDLNIKPVTHTRSLTHTLSLSHKHTNKRTCKRTRKRTDNSFTFYSGSPNRRVKQGFKHKGTSTNTHLHTPTRTHSNKNTYTHTDTQKFHLPLW